MSGSAIVLKEAMTVFAPNFGNNALVRVLNYAEAKRRDNLQFQVKLKQIDSYFKNVSNTRQALLEDRGKQIMVLKELITLAREIGDRDLSMELLNTFKDFMNNTPDYLNGVTKNSSKIIDIN